jgi:fermentation-respiration switch protein FrsA (DUF1100 family)
LPKRANAQGAIVVPSIVHSELLATRMIFENRLLYPVPPPAAVVRVPADAEAVTFASADGTRLNGWFADRADQRRVLMYFHGNAEDVERAWPEMSELAGSLDAALFVFDYRGYGLSEGKPSETGIVEDGAAALRWVMQQRQLPANQIILVGRSLGAGVAAQVAARHPPQALVLLSGFSSMVDVAAAMFPLFPVRWLMRNRYDSESVLASTAFPVFQVHGVRDGIIPVRFGRRLFEALPSTEKEFLELPNRGHNDFGWPDYGGKLRQFLDGLQVSGTSSVDRAGIQ